MNLNQTNHTVMIVFLTLVSYLCDKLIHLQFVGAYEHEKLTAISHRIQEPQAWRP